LKYLRHYHDYEKYINFQSEKTKNQEKRSKWLNEEWDSKILGFKNEFKKIAPIINKDSRVLCIGARTGQEVVAFREMGAINVIGIDLVPNIPHVIECDAHSISYDENTFDIVYTNIINHSIDVEKMISEIERVLKVDGFLFLQCQIGMESDQYDEVLLEHPVYDILPLFNRSFCVGCHPIETNFAKMNFEFIFRKDNHLNEMYNKYGSFSDMKIPLEYEKLWNDINLEIQNKKLDSAGIISNKMRKEILDNLKKRGFFLTRIAESFDCKDIAEVGTAEGWQYFTFCKYIKDNFENTGSVDTCDPRDVRNKDYVKAYSDNRFSYTMGTSKEMSMNIGEKDFFYIDGLHDKGSVIYDVINLEKNQCSDKKSVWIFDDFDERFGCVQDIFTLCQLSQCFKIYKVGKTASGKPSHQAIAIAKFSGNEEK
jgi:ubiquinone/menaquinone biosynthesis C-methylase UbiE